MSEPRIYRANYVDSSCNFTGLNGGNPAYFYDRNNAVQFVTSGANSDTVSVYPVIEFSQTRMVDHVIVINHNIADLWLSFLYWDGTAFVAPNNLTSSTMREKADSAHTTFTFNWVATTKIAIGLGHTAVANEEKKVGELIACAEGMIAFIRTDLSSYAPTFRQKSKEIALGDGSLHVANTIGSNGSLLKYEANCQFKHLTSTELKYLYDIKQEGGTFLWHPESQARPQDIYLVRWAGNFSPRYSSSYKGAGWTVDMQVKEV